MYTIFVFVHSLCTAFRRTFRRIDGETSDKEVMGRHTAFYHLGRALLEAGQYFGQILGAQETVFHGQSGELYFKALTAYFNTPTSTTKSELVGM